MPAPQSSDDNPPETSPNEADELDQLAQEQQPGLIRELIGLALENKKWWLLPIIAVLLLVSLLIIITGTIGPFIYPLL